MTTDSSKFSLKIGRMRTDENYKRADYIELLCLISKDGIISRSEINTRLQLEDDIDMNVEDFDDIEYDTPGDIGSQEAEVNDKREVVETDWVRQIRFRSSTFGKYYPFEIDESGYSVIRKDITDHHRIYIIMLAASSLANFSDHKKALTDTFERISADAIKQLLSPKAEIHNFGAGMAGNPMRLSTKYTNGNVLQRIQELGEDLKLRVIARSEDFHPKNSGDEGLDLIAWLPFADKRTGMIIMFGQCACTEDWKEKQHSSSMNSWKNKLVFNSDIINAVFIPFFFRDSTGDWHNFNDIKNTILFDRLRIIQLLDENYVTTTLPILTAIASVNSIISLREEEAV